MSDFRFANPSWVHAMWLVLVLVALMVWFDQRGRTALEKLLSRSMQARLVRRLPPGRRWLSIALVGLAAACLVVGLMRPQWGLTYHQTPRVGAQLMVCLDVSKSMLAEDTAPNRLERAKAELTDLLGFLDGDQVGLIAFAGRAAVLCPLTPDFGFFRLILDEAGPHSVGLGGTRLSQPIEKALAGFGSESDVSRAILLITDGEDHGSYALDAAKAAAERGIKIIAIGFGDEAGSRIEITDAETGVRSVLRDGDGQPVITKLDGETLREMAMVTDGAYVPAGTGALDLRSIYNTHLASLVRGQLDDRGHAVRREAFQWAVLLGLVFLIAAVIVGNGSSADRVNSTSTLAVSSGRAATAAVLLAMLVANSVYAQPANVSPQTPVGSTDEPQAAPPANAEERPTNASEEDEPSDPRATYNEALAMLDADAERAQRLLTRARRDAETDGEVRFRATYNLGWADVKLAGKLLEENPQQALEHLRSAAGWFRDAIRLRPQNKDARHNLEVVLRRALELSDSLAKKDERDLKQQLDELIEQQRSLLGEASDTVQQLAASDDPNAADRFRVQFRSLAVQQRTILSDSQVLTKAASEELESLQSKKDEEQDPEQQMRAAQLTNLLHYANRANQRMGQARSQMRRRQGDRAYRRASSALNELKRARDQLRDPVEVLGVLLADSLTLNRFTSMLVTAGALITDTASITPPPPAWLTQPYLVETQESLTERTAELEARLQAGLKQQGDRPLGPASPNQPLPDPQAERFLSMVRQAVPFVTEGKEAFQAAHETLRTEQLESANERQREAIIALTEARERFLDLRGLIETTYAGQSQVHSILDLDEEQVEQIQQHLSELTAVSRQIQDKNVERTSRLDQLIDDEMAALPNPDQQTAPPAAGPTGQNTAEDEEAVQAQRQRLVLAKQLVEQSRAEMTAARDALGNVSQTEPPDGPELAEASEQPEEGGSEEGGPVGESSSADQEPMHEARDAAGRASEHLQSLRRLFFSVVEHLRETAQRQAQLNDETQQVAALPESEAENIAKQIGPLVPQQRELQQMATQIADALAEQAKQTPEAMSAQPGADPQQAQQQAQLQQQATEKLEQAAKLVEDAGGAMINAVGGMEEAEPALKPVRQEQDTALEKLAEALALLVPPEQQPPQDQGDQQQENQQQDNQQQQQDDQQQQAGVDPARMLQAIRDREAQRRKEKSQQQPASMEPVDKDW